MERIYLDWAATALPDRELLREAAERADIFFANPSSKHKSGTEAAKHLESCRKNLARTFGTAPDRLHFTSGGTEANNMVLLSLLNKKRPGNIVISGYEHPSVYEPAAVLKNHGWEVRRAGSGKNGIISVGDITGKIDKNTRMVALIMVNNETGAIQPIREVGEKLAQTDSSIHFHVDAVQAAGKLPLSFTDLNAHSASISSHKFRGPRGCGILYLNKSVEMLYSGGGQEGGIRHGTENMFGITGTAAAAEKALDKMSSSMSLGIRNKKRLIERISAIRGARFIPDCPHEELLNTGLYSPFILSFSIKPVPGEVMVRVMSDRGFDISTGSACAAGKKNKSNTLETMGISNEDAFSTIRISTGPETGIEEIDSFCDTLEKESAILRKSL